MPESSTVKERVLEEARRLHFDACGVAPARPKVRDNYLRDWIASGQHGDMEWMARTLEKRLDPDMVLPGVRSIIVVALNYHRDPAQRRGQIARYALGKDYHKLLNSRLKQLCRFLRESCGAKINKPTVDTAPVLEKPAGEAAGIGWQGKHTNLIHPQLGNWLFLGTVLTSLELPPDKHVPDRCGSCTRCIDICPTRAITAPYRLDSSRCISYLTIEHKGPIPLEFRRAIGDHLFGCDDCLAVCPWNRWARQTRELRFEPIAYPDLREMLAWDDEAFHNATAGTPIRRLKRPRWLRNVCVVLGNIGDSDDLPALRAAAADPHPLVAEHAQWAIEEIERRTAG